MNSTSEVIIKQLENEGVTCETMFGIQTICISAVNAGNYLGFASTFADAVQDAVKRSIRITALLSKLQDSLGADEQDELGDLLIDPQEAR